MNLNEIMEAYENKRTSWNNKLIQLQEKVNTLAERLRKHEEKKPYFYDNVTKKLAEELLKETGLKYYDIYGPFGIEAEVSIYLSNYGKKNRIEICEVETYGLTLRPTKNGFSYWTGEKTNEYPKGSIGYMNGLNNVHKDLPNDIKEIVKLLRYSPGKEA